MIHRNDERMFRLVELTCYGATVILVPVVRVYRGMQWPYFMPLAFVMLASVGLVFMTRFFIYAHPEQIFDRTRAESIVLTKEKKVALAIGFSMCIPMLTLGSIGLFSPPTMNRIISAVSPMRFILS